MSLLHSSRRTIRDGEVVTFATAFVKRDGVFGDRYETYGPFQVSASRNAVVVHHGCAESPDEIEALIDAIRAAEHVRHRLAQRPWGGEPSHYPEIPTPWPATAPKEEA